MVPDRNCSAVCWNRHHCCSLRHKEQSSTSTLHQFTKGWWVKKNTTTSYRQKFLQTITELKWAKSLADSNENHIRAVKNHSLPARSFQATPGLNQTLQCQCPAWTRRFPSRSRKPAATASWKQTWIRHSWKESKFEATRQMQRAPQIGNALVMSRGRGHFPWPVRSSTGSKGHTWADSCCSRRGMKTQRWNDVCRMKDADGERLSGALSVLRMSFNCALLLFFFFLQYSCMYNGTQKVKDISHLYICTFCI